MVPGAEASSLTYWWSCLGPRADGNPEHPGVLLTRSESRAEPHFTSRRSLPASGSPAWLEEASGRGCLVLSVKFQWGCLESWDCQPFLPLRTSISCLKFMITLLLGGKKGLEGCFYLFISNMVVTGASAVLGVKKNIDILFYFLT